MLVASKNLLVAVLALVGVCFVTGAGIAGDAKKDYPVQPVPFTDVRITDELWAPRMETNRKITIPYDFRKCEETGRIANFDVAAGRIEGKFRGHFGFNDSDVFKVIEGASYSLALYPDAELEKYLDELIGKIAAAQMEDGYIYTVNTIKERADEIYCCVSEQRWSDLNGGHELYNAGHMYEAAVAHYQATGKRSFLDVAIKNADLLCRVFGSGKNRGVPGHQEVEIGLVKLYRVTGDKKYLKLAKFFLDQRGNSDGHKLYGSYNQDHKPVVEQDGAVGHAVRACYMYSGMADVAALTDDKDYIKAMDRIWENVVSKKQHITGGVGARHKGESFGENYELPNKTTYNETCAAIANAMWNHRLFLLSGDAKYIDVLERVLYNGFLSGVSLGGDEFFYPNPLASDGKYKFNQGALTRKAWFDCSCCPTNVVRFMPSIAGYVYAQRDDAIYVNLFVEGSGAIEVGDNKVMLKQKTRYPWDGRIRIRVVPKRPSAEFPIYVRIPGWVRNQPAPSDLYRYLKESDENVILKVNGKPVVLEMEKGFARIRRRWKEGDLIELDLPMPIRRVVCNEKVKANAGRIALERGPIVYCAEGVDNGGQAFNIVLADDVKLETEYREAMLGGVTVISGKAYGLYTGEDGKSVETKEQDFTAVPYYTWSHRGVGEMLVWLPRKVMLNFDVQ
ncbi:MAG: glycoside hydrolase family 127 protein [Planctomycetota bacterium]|jgi:DUF1680 family protein